MVPIEYDAAIHALQACISLDEAKYWSNKADALAAWAKMYRSDRAGVEAKKLKLHAYRRMGQIAEEMRPRKPGTTRGPLSLLNEHLPRATAQESSVLARLPSKKFDEMISRPTPPSPSTAMKEYRFSNNGCSASWQVLMTSSGAASLVAARGFCAKHDAASLGRGLNADEAGKVRIIIQEISDWLDELERVLPKEKR